MAASKNILLIRLNSLGDALFTLPAVHDIWDNFPPAWKGTCNACGYAFFTWPKPAMVREAELQRKNRP